MHKQLGFKMNLQRCVGCRGCEMACRNEHGSSKTGRRKVQTLASPGNHVIVYLSMACNHCENPACIGVCPKRCFKKRRDGIVIHDPLACIGCKSCIGACPFDAPTYNYVTKKVDKCNMCVDRLEIGLKPACVSACAMGALEITNVKEAFSLEEEKWYSGIKMANYTNPSVRFIPPKSHPSLHGRMPEFETGDND